MVVNELRAMVCMTSSHNVKRHLPLRTPREILFSVTTDWDLFVHSMYNATQHAIAGVNTGPVSCDYTPDRGVRAFAVYCALARSARTVIRMVERLLMCVIKHPAVPM
jgi:hypothetical protein